MTNIKAAPIRLLFVWALTISAHAATIIVTNTSDNGPGSLRQALAIANDGDTIDATGISGVITLTSGELLVGKSVTINGAGADLLAVDGNGAGTVFQVVSMGPVIISDLTIRNAQGRFGGGIFNGGVGALTIINSTVSGNTAAFGGGIYNGGTLNIINSTISGNTANEGAGVYNPVTLTIVNSTFSNNAASQVAGAVFNTGTLVIANSTISNNTSAFLAGGVVNLNNFQIGNTILNEGHASANIYNNGNGVVMSRGYNLSSDDAFGILTGPGDQINTNPMLGPLQNNGGPTFTHALLPGSPAINTGDPNFTPPPDYDQRGPGFPRVANGRIDKGSFEMQPPVAQSAFSRKTHGAAGTFDINLPLTGTTGVESRSGGGTHDYTIVVTFSGHVAVTGSPQAQVTLGTGCVGSGGTCDPNGAVSISGNVVTIPLTTIADVQTINVTLHGVTSASDALAVDVTIPMSILIGDVNANRAVNSSDVALTKSQVGQPVTMSNFREDVNVNGTITATDVAIVKSDVGHALPP